MSDEQLPLPGRADRGDGGRYVPVHAAPRGSRQRGSVRRRGFLSAAALAAAGAAAGAGGVLGYQELFGPGRIGGGRLADALAARTEAARQQLDGGLPEQRTNGDEQRYQPGLVSFTKSLPHNQLGEVEPEAYQTLLRAVESGRREDFDQVPVADGARLVNPQAAYGFELEGADPWALSVDPPPPFASEAFAAEMVECYWLALARDVPYARYGDEPIAAAAIEDLRRFEDYADVDAQTLFRSNMSGVATGPYVSQFLLQPYLFGDTPTEQRYRTTVEGSDYLTSYDEWLQAQNGALPAAEPRYDEQPRYIRNGRDLAIWAHQDFSYQGALVATLILLGYAAEFGPEVLDEGNPYRDNPTQSGMVTFGASHVLDLVSRLTNPALRAAWYQKWLVHRRFRPEEAAGRVHSHMTGEAEYPLDAKLTDSAAPAAVFDRYGSYLCPQAYPEGCPIHPAYPGGTATAAGAGVTVLKAFFNEGFEIPNPVVPSEDGRSLQPYEGERLTVGGELNKLAFNMAFGRDTAGVHFRRDGLRGITLGEASALSVITGRGYTYSESFEGFSLTTFGVAPGG